MKNNRLVMSIGICTWNRNCCLNNLLKSIFSQKFKFGNFEILIADSCSSDGTKDTIKKYNDLYKNICYFNCDNSLAVKRNEIIKKAKGEILVLFDDDVVLSPNCLNEHYYANFKKNDCFYCGQVRFEKNLVKKFNYYHFRDEQHLPPYIKNGLELKFFNIVAMNMSSRTQNFRRVGFFDESFIGYGCEDLDYGYRIISSSYKIFYVPSALIYHHENSSNIIAYGDKLYKTGLYGSRILKKVNFQAWNCIYGKKERFAFLFKNENLKRKLEEKLIKEDLNSNKYCYLKYKFYIYFRYFEGVKMQKYMNMPDKITKETSW